MTANTEITELIRSELCRFLQYACAGKTGVKLDMDNPAAEVSAPLGFDTGYTAQFWAERLADRLNGHEPSLFGVPLIDSVTAAKGHVAFRISIQAYNAMTHHIIESCKLPDVPDKSCDDVSYALIKSLMLARKGGEGIPDTASIKKALWLGISAGGFSGAKRAALNMRCAAAVLGIFDGMKDGERDALAARLGLFGQCAARLIWVNSLQEV